MKFFFSFFFLFLSSKGLALSQLEKQEKIDACEQAYKTYLLAKDRTDQVGRYAVTCRQECDQTKWGFGDARSMAHYGECSGATSVSSGAAQKCLAGKTKINSGQSYDSAVWEACFADCGQAVNEATSSADKSTYSQIANSCQKNISQNPEPIDPNGDSEEDGDTIAEDDSGSDDLEPADSGLPNQNALNSAYQGLGLGNTGSRTPIDGGRGADFSGGSSARGFGDLGQGSGGGGFGDPAIYPPIRINDTPGQGGEVVQGSYAQPGGGTSGGGGGGGIGGPSGGSPSRGGGGGGARTSIAGAQLNKVGQNSFWAAEGGGASGSSSGSRKTAATTAKTPKEKKTKFGPSYINKGDSLLKLFGGPLKVSQTPGSQSCADNTVFCTHENFFERVERYPSSEIKQTPQ